MKKLTHIILAIISAGTLHTACTPIDDYEKYLVGGEISYTGKLDSVRVYSGFERVMLQGLLISDPKVTGCIVYWNNRQDSLDIKVNRSEEVDTLRQIIELPEMLYNFEIYTYDHLGNRSIPVYKSGQSYGSNFVNRLNNRPLNGHPIADEKGLTVHFLPVDMTLGPIHSIISYTNKSGKNDTVHVEINQESCHINDFQPGTPFQYITTYVPDSLCIDTFPSRQSDLLIPYQKISDLTIHNFSSQEEKGESNGTNGWAKHAIDNDLSTYWHSQWKDQHPGFPHFLSFNLQKECEVKAVAITPRQNSHLIVKDFKLFTSPDGDTWQEVESFRMNNVRNEQQFFVLKQPIHSRYVKLLFENAHVSDPHTAIAEISFYE